MTLIKDLIDIPDGVQKGDFVLRLAEDINRPEVVLDNYVVTPDLRTCFDAALPFIGSSVENRMGDEIAHEYNQRMDEVFEGFVTEEAKNLGLTIEEIKGWQPPKKSAPPKKKAKG